MDKFSIEPHCAKCGHNKATSEYRKTSLDSSGRNVIEFIVRKCENCGYSWHELPLDSDSTQLSTK